MIECIVILLILLSKKNDIIVNDDNFLKLNVFVGIYIMQYGMLESNSGNHFLIKKTKRIENRIQKHVSLCLHRHLLLLVCNCNKKIVDDSLR